MTLCLGSFSLYCRIRYIVRRYNNLLLTTKLLPSHLQNPHLKTNRTPLPCLLKIKDIQDFPISNKYVVNIENQYNEVLLYQLLKKHHQRVQMLGPY